MSRASTRAFLGINHNFEPTGPPILFETMIHDERTDERWDEQWRTTTCDLAEKQHADAVDYVRRKLAGMPDG